VLLLLLEGDRHVVCELIWMMNTVIKRLCEWTAGTLTFKRALEFITRTR
jgi:hypothetical protein